MSKKTILILWAVVAILALGVFSLSSQRKDNGEARTERSRGQTLLKEFPASSVKRIVISSTTDSVTLQKNASNWQVTERQNYPANVANVNHLLRTVEEVKITNCIEAGATYAKRFGVDDTSKDSAEHGTQYQFQDENGQLIAAIAVGKDSEGGGRFIRNKNDNSGVYVTQESFSVYGAEPKSWLDEDFINVNEIKSITISKQGSVAEQEWKVARQDANSELELTDKKPEEKMNPNVGAGLKGLFSYARFQDLIDNQSQERLAKAKNRRVATLETFKGFTYKLTFAPKSDLDQPNETKDNKEASSQNDEAYALSLEVSATFAKERTKADKETEEEAKTKDKEFQDNLKKLEDQLAKEQQLQKKIYEISKNTVETLLKSRADLIEAPTSANAADSAGRSEAVTPPLQIQQ